MAVATVIVILACLASAAGVDTLGLVFVGASGLLVAGAALRFGGERWFAPRPAEPRISAGLRMLVAALGALALIPLIYWAGMAYGASWLERDAAHATNVYVERPGGFIVVLASFVICAALFLVAFATFVVAVVRALRKS